MTQAEPRALLWDLDGTLLDSRDIHWEAWRTFLAGHGRPMTYASFQQIFGFRNEITLRQIFGPRVPDREVEQYSREKEALFRELLSKAGVQPLPGVCEWLAWARARGWRQGLATMAPRENIEVALIALNLAGAFDAIVGAEEVQHGKPDPEVFLLAAQRLGVPPVRCTVIEDSAQGVEAARRAGMRCVGVGPLYGQLRADITLRTLSDAGPQILAEG